MADTNFNTRLVAVGNNASYGVVEYENSSGNMTALNTSNDLAKETQMAVIPGFGKVYFAQGTTYRVADFSVPNWNTWTLGTGGPANSNIGCLYRARIVLAGNTTAGEENMWYMSRQGDPDDWVYGANDAQSPVAGGQAEAARGGDIITALIPYTEDYLIIGCAHTVELMRGDPAAGGTLTKIIDSDGIFGPDAWCMDGVGNMYYFGSVGMYRMEVGQTKPKPINIDRIPNMMENIDRDNYRITMGYDARNHGILVAMTKLTIAYQGLPRTSGKGTGFYYWYDLRTDGFFPETYLDGTQGPYSVFFYDSDEYEYQHLLLGGADGYIRRFDKDEKTDETGAGIRTAIDSKVLMGPIDISSGNMQGKINDLAVTLGSNTDDANYDIYVNNSSEELLDAVEAEEDALWTGRLVGGGRHHNIKKKARGAALAIKLSNDDLSETFAVEKVAGNIEPAGRLKLS